MDSEKDNLEPQQGGHKGRMSGQSLMRNIFGIFMVLIYIGFGILLFINFFQWDANFAWLRWTGGVLFIIYGIWRGYRQAKGIDTYR